MRRLVLVTSGLLAAALMLGGCGGASTRTIKLPPGPLMGIHKIQHVVIIQQENRSFDTYFGTYPGANGIPGLAGNPGLVPCLPNPKQGRCEKPFHDRLDRNVGGPHGSIAARLDIDQGRMDGFVAEQNRGIRQCERTDNPACGGTSGRRPDVMGYHTGADIPNYWDYARHFVLNDHMFQSDASWSLPAHLYLVSGWSARCKVPGVALSCNGAIENPGYPPDFARKVGIKHPSTPDYAWTDITYLLHKYGVSWSYYVFKGGEPDCEQDSQIACTPHNQSFHTPGIWNPLPYFDTVRTDHQRRNIKPLSAFFADAKAGKLPKVTWVMPNDIVSEHPPGLVSVGQSYVTGLINAIMRSPEWKSTAIFLSWDDWGGVYDHVEPPKVDYQGYGLRVPGLVISPYAKHGYVDHQTLSFDAYLKFIEDDFMGAQRLDPRTDGRPDLRPDVRENEPALGNLLSDFDFSEAPRPPMLLPLHPKTDLISPAAQRAGAAARLKQLVGARGVRALAAYLGISPAQFVALVSRRVPLRKIAQAHGRSVRGLLLLAARLQRRAAPQPHRRSRRR